MKDYQRDFIALAMRENVLKFGSFTLKSGRLSPYFFNAGLFNSGECLAKLGSYYASAIIDSQIEFDVLFGPAYKGIPLAAATAVALYEQQSKSVPYAFNRKEAKDHGECGVIVGADLSGKRVLIIDDVITAGTAIREAIDIIRAAGGEPVGVVLALDRQERGKDSQSAVQEVREQMNLQVFNIVQLDNIIAYLETDGKTTPDVLATIRAYKKQYGV